MSTADQQREVFFDDGDGQMFTRLTNSLDVTGHELTHGVTQYTANLVTRASRAPLTSRRQTSSAPW